jgi:glutamate/tyrosine decarboxylase-like PLP-dependent enzyme
MKKSRTTKKSTTARPKARQKGLHNKFAEGRNGSIPSLVSKAFRSLEQWKSRWPEFEEDKTLHVSSARMAEVIGDLLERLEDNYPFQHPSYAGQMLKPPHPIASIAYFLTQQINPNNHALDGGPATAKMELEVVSKLAEMFGFRQHLGHLTSSGTIANLEALWIARSIHPGKAIAFSSEAHYTHRRMCDVIGVESVEIAADGTGRMNLDDLRSKLKSQKIGTVVTTAGTTGLGAVDPIDEIEKLRKEFGFRIHVDAAYGGFFRLLASSPGVLEESSVAAYKAMEYADSIVVDPHKHGLQPYGCGSVLFRDPAVGRFYKHDSPYTYFTSKELHLGEISLECSRAGAAAAALWATIQCFPLESNTGLGAILRKTRKAALAFAGLINDGRIFRLITEPALDIVAYFPVGKDLRVSTISRNTDRIFNTTMNSPTDPVYLAKMILKPQMLTRHSDLAWDAPTVTVLRSVLMKPEHLQFAPKLYRQLANAATMLRSSKTAGS